MDTEKDMKRVGRRPDSAKRDRILLAAQEIFSERGFTATSMSAVAERAAVAKLTAYRHFGSKDELFTAAVTARCETMLASTAEAPAETLDPRAALLGFGRAFLGLILHAEAIAIHRLIVAERDRAPQLGPLFHSAAIQPTQQRLAALIQRLRIDVDDPSLAATDLLALWRGKPMLPIEMGMPGWTAAEIDAHVARTVDLCLAGWQRLARAPDKRSD
jgi:TetR/AcrR family transcriptional regulator, mexJK operon transcriptional repressor